MTHIVYVTLAVLLLVGVLSYLWAISLSKRILRLMRSADALAAGDLERATQLLSIRSK